MAHESGGPHFYLGTHQPAWLTRARVPLFVSDVRLRTYKDFETGPRARASWALDSGGFTELSTHGRWTVEPLEYVQRVKAYDLQIGNLDWAAPQDWMCEPWIIAKTGLSVREHQERTVENFVELERLWQFWDAKFTFHSGAESPFMPVLQGWTVEDYWLCIDLYAQAGVRLADYPLVGLGSVCRRQATGEIETIVRSLGAVLRLHGFGVKTSGLACYGRWLHSADSMAWSVAGRRTRGCSSRHTSEANCLPFALRWRQNVLRAAADASTSEQLSLFPRRARPAAEVVW
jgi:hypothetical protein